ncbi:MAG: hypothetical protein KGI35_15330, partial [Burkholderiales bacterium]|nr:hypothetical protein [Burkholderiales bacterium]
MRNPFVVSCLLLGLAGPAAAQLGVAISLPGVSIGIDVPIYPELVRVPGYPVYYAPRLAANYFFYDGMYWVLQDDDWYASDWYDGPWSRVSAQAVPLFVLRIPVRYFRSPPGYFRGWQADAAPRWGEHWGPAWQQRRRGWDRWDRQRVPAAAPLPAYQRQYPAARYPQAEQQQAIRSQNYRYQPHEAVVRQHFQEAARQPAPQPTARPQPMPAQRAPREVAPPQP